MIPTIGSTYANFLTKITYSPENTTSSRSNQSARTQPGAAPGTTPTGAPVTAQESQSYRVTISEEALRKAGLLKDTAQTSKTGAPAEKNSQGAKNSSADTNSQDTLKLDNLKRIDREVRAHEQAHVIAGGSLVRGAANFGYATGPDGKMYAVSGEVSIDTSPVQDDPQATVRKMIQVTKAALAPAQPSGQDRSVASSAMKTQVDAQQQVTQQQLEKMQGDSTESTSPTPAGAAKTKKTDPETKPTASPEAPSKPPSNNTQLGNQKLATFQTRHINILA